MRRDLILHGAHARLRLAALDSALLWLAFVWVPGRTMALAIRNLALGNGRRPAVHILDLEVPKGSLSAGVGPNGADTSTLRGEAIWLACGVGQLRVPGPDPSAT
jgi:hypothetical protein